MKIDIPDRLYPYFLSFLDVAQAMFLEDEIALMEEEEKEVLKFVEDLLGDECSMRFQTAEDKHEAVAAICKFYENR